ncbi:hypothetical protein GCM10027429_31330 [Marivirga atlantica]|jgi:hypothetical protein|uniref:Outer membrane protein beta-barrel domain-containing protein n=1 Tax=Marivirga atlantica TaxID=1548457 RepID=A0A937AH95_9BACT|nr:hypothetical protein [Marivirga atlantica]MBL0766711.1 hypothetical protein [Marivirga atlantica]
MKKVLLLLAILAVSLQLNAQSGNYYEEEEFSTNDLPVLYLGIGTGTNSYTGLLGGSINYRVQNKLFIQAGLGLSTWGYRSSIGLRYDRGYDKGFTFGLGVANSSGVNNILLELETANGDIRELDMKFYGAFTLNIKAGYNFKVGNNGTFYINLGYAVPFEQQPWNVKDGTSLSVTSQQVLEILAPGGLIFGTGFTVGF